MKRITELTKSIAMIIKNMAICIKNPENDRDLGIYQCLLMKNIREKRKVRNKCLK
jgi:hypothetical protein